MKKLGALILGAILTIGIGAGISVKPATDVAKAEETVVHEIDTTGTLQGSNNSYTSNCDVTVNGIKWNLEGNSKINPWRLGGKSTNTKNANRNVYTKTAFAENISKIELFTGTTKSLTVNSLTMNVGTTAKGSDVSSITATFKTSSTIAFTRPADANWANCYFSFCFNLTATTTSNGYVQFKGAKFYTVPEINPDAETIEITSGLEKTEYYVNETEWDTTGLTSSVEDVEYSFYPASPAAAGIGTTTLKITASKEGYNSGSFDQEVTILGLPEPEVIAVETFKDAINYSAAEMTQKFTIKGVEVTGWYDSSKTDGTEYGNVTVTDGTTSILSYGMTATESALSWNGTAYTYTNKQDFLTNSLTKTIKVGSELDLTFVVTSYGSTKQLNSIVSGVNNPNDTAAEVAATIKELAGGWENEVATVNCYANYEKVNEMILALSAEELETFKTSTDTEIASARTTYEHWCFANGATPYSETVTAGLRLNVLNDTNSVLVIVSIIALVTMLGAVTMLVIRKRKYSK